MVNGRDKGANWERKLGKILELELGIKFARNLEQYRSADEGDLIADNPDFPFSIEAKAYAKGVGCRDAWWNQASKAAASAHKLPAVIYKYNNYKPRVVISFSAICAMFDEEEDEEDLLLETSIEGFCYICRELMNK
jgi:hypothetical protein